MTARTASKLDTEKFRKVHGLMTGGATPGERAAAKARAEAMAKKAGMTLTDAVSKLDGRPASTPRNIFEGFDDWMEGKEPGWKAAQARERNEREVRNDARRADVLKQYGSEAALFARTEREALLDEAIEPLATWSCWTDDAGAEHRYAKTIDGQRADFWSIDRITPAIRKALVGVYPWPSTLEEAMREVKVWDRLSRDRALFSGGEWSHYAEVDARIALLEHELNAGRPHRGMTYKPASTGSAMLSSDSGSSRRSGTTLFWIDWRPTSRFCGRPMPRRYLVRPRAPPWRKPRPSNLDTAPMPRSAPPSCPCWTASPACPTARSPGASASARRRWATGGSGGVHKAQCLAASHAVNYGSRVIEVRQTARFAEWLRDLRNANARGRILQRIARLQRGSFGDAKFFEEIGELRIDYGPGYRAYFVKRGDTLVFLLCGGDKRTQDRDIRTAKAMAEEV